MPLDLFGAEQMAKREKLIHQLIGGEPVETPFGTVMNALGATREKAASYLAGGNVAEPEKRLPPGPVENFLASLLPYETSARSMVMSQISPVYHGSPYKFNKFKNEAIGTGEGAQSFGYGHYMTDEFDVAKHYANIGTRRSMYGIGIPEDIKNLVKANSPEAPEKIKDLVSKIHGEYSSKRRFAEEQGNKGIAPSQTVLRRIDELAQQERNLVGIRNKLLSGERVDFPEENIYEATLHKGKKPGEYEYLRWDEPVDIKMLDKIKSKFRDLGFDEELINGLNTKKGEYFYRSLSDTITKALNKKAGSEIFRADDKLSSEFLKGIGIDGIKYPAGSLSGVKSDKFNYVVFDPEDIAIEAIK